MLNIKIEGVVQGIGFRPFIFRLAKELALNGYVVNTTSGVEIEITGEKEKIDEFLKRIKTQHPPAAEIKKIIIKEKKDKMVYSSFEIKESINKKGFTLISPDLAVCSNCIEEMCSIKDPRYKYAFINCTNCGPRYSIIEDLPYDRPKTTMKKFRMCDFCYKEYIDPLNRRFHAQPTACPRCGPHLQLLNHKFEKIKGDPVKNTIKLLQKGKIVGIKGIGGFHIACDATNKKTVELLRKRKNRPHKPFAVLVHPDKIYTIVHCSEAQLKLLKSPAAPIVILKKKEKWGKSRFSEKKGRPLFFKKIRQLLFFKSSLISENVAPDNPCLGLFLPYAPVHYMILNEDLPFLIMTSGNFQDEPISVDEKELGGICDYYLTNNRPIKNRSDDSIIMPLDIEKNILIRRSRGYVPLPFELPFDTIPTLGCGAELKLTFSLSKKNILFISPYIGNADNKKTIDHFSNTVETYKEWFKIEPELVAADLHPDYFSTRFADQLGLPVIKIQHHFAHIASVMAEYKINEPVIGIAYDGTGYGTDGKIWGSEIMIVEYKNFHRKFHLNYMPLPGGDAATKHPARIACAYLMEIEEDETVVKNISDLEKKIISRQMQNKFNLFYTSSMGRLFDCVSALLELIDEITYEAQAPMLLEFLAGNISYNKEETYTYIIEEDIINIKPMLKQLIQDIKKKKSPALISAKFHNTIIKFTLDSIKKLNKLTGIKKVVLSGGVIQNRIILNGLLQELSKSSFQTFIPEFLPVNDGCISAGQVVIANVLSHTR